MGAISNYQLTLNECIVNNDFQDLKLLEIESKFWGKYLNKKYDKLNLEIINKLCKKKTKLVISDSFYEMLKTNKVLLEIYLVLKLSKSNMKQGDLIKYGFKLTSLKYSINQLIGLGILDKNKYLNSKLLKLKKYVLRNKGEKQYVLSGKDTFRIFLLYGLKTALLYSINKYKSKKYSKASYLKSVETRKKVILQNAYYSMLRLSRNEIYLSLKSICAYFDCKYKEMFNIVRIRKEKFITLTNNNTGENFHLFIGYKFTTERYLLMRI